MDKRSAPSIFVNDGSFMEKFKQLQQEKEKEIEKKGSIVASKPVLLGAVTPKSSIIRTSKASDTQRTNHAPSGGKLAFSLKQKSKLVAPAVKLGGDEDDEDERDVGNLSIDAAAKRQKLVRTDSFDQPTRKGDVVAPPLVDPTMKNVADKLATFVAKNGRQFEDITRQKNPGDTPFKFLFDKSCAGFKYYEHRLAEEEKMLSQAKDSEISHSGGTSSSALKATGGSKKTFPQQSNYHMPASALFEVHEESGTSVVSGQPASLGRTVESSAPSSADPIAMMEFYMKKAAQEERKRQPRQSKDEMPPPLSLQVGKSSQDTWQSAPGKKGHHMGDYIPQEELEKFLATCNDVACQKAAKETQEKSKIQADNVGHKLLSKMGWKEGEALGSSTKGIADPIMAGEVKVNNLGVGAHNPGEVTPEDDIYEQYKKRMMLGYRYRPNPLGNPRKSYY